jgi:hypothetical protein
MAFRIKAATGACVMLCLSLAHPAQAAGLPSMSYEARHRHLRKGGSGILRITGESISWEEHAKTHARLWKYEDIQQLVLSAETLRIVTYTGQHWRLGDETYVFDKLPPAVAADWYPRFREKLDERFVAALAADVVSPKWQIPAKLLHGRVGSQGTLLMSTGEVVYKSASVGESRTWRIGDIENVSSSDPFDLTVTTRERDFRFQLKESLSESRYNDFWREVNRTKGMRIGASATIP